MLSPTLDTLRLFLHVLAASIWVGGQFVLAGLVPSIRATNRELLPRIARQFARLSWPAFAIVVLTGMWSLAEVNLGAMDTDYQVTVFLKILFAMISATAAVIHSVGQTKAAKAVGGAVTLLAGTLAMFLGLLLQSGA